MKSFSVRTPLPARYSHFLSRAICTTAGLFILALFLPISSFGASAPNAAAGLITTLTLANTSPSIAVPSNSDTPMFGHVFRKGDIPNGCSGSAPAFKLNDGVTPVPFSESLKPVCWSDGSLKFAAFMLRVPDSGAGNAIPANRSITIGIYNGGSTPAASGRKLSDFANAGTDLNLSISAPDSTLSGTWVSDLNQGVSAANGDNYQYMDGQAGAVWRVRASFRQSGANHGQLEAYWYVQALNDGSNALAGVRYMARIGQPWYDVNTPAKNYRTLATMRSFDGARLLHDYLAGHFITQNFTYSGSGSEFAANSNGLEPFQLAYITCSVSCPTGLSAETPYFIGGTTTNTFSLVVHAGGSTPIVPTGAGSGTFTVTTYPVVTIFGSLFTADSNGKMEYVQAGGSVAADATIQVKFNNTYWRSSRMMPPYDLSSGISPNPTGHNLNGSPFAYFPDTINETTGFIRNVGSTGQSLEMGLLPPWAARHFYTQELQEEYDTRITALSASIQPTWIKNSATGTFPCVVTGTYVSMGACIPSFQFGGDSAHTHGFTYVDTNVPNGAFSGGVIDFSHWSANVAYALLATGEPEYFDIVGELANAAIWERDYNGAATAVITANEQWMGGKRSSTINGTLYDPFMAWFGSLLRSDAWSMRDLEFAAAMMPATSYEGGANESQYFRDVAHTNFLAFNAFWPLLDPGTQSMGFWNETSGGSNVNTSAFFLAAVGYSAQINEDTAAQNFYNYLALWPVQFHTRNSMWNFSYYAANDRSTLFPRLTFNHYITDLAHFCILTPGPTVTWSAGGHFTVVTNGYRGYTLQNGDKFLWTRDNTPIKPSVMSFDTPYYAVNFSSSIFDLSPTPGGAAIPVTDTAASAGPACVLPGNAPATGNIQAQGTGSYQYLFGQAMNLGVANGFSVDSATLTDITTRWMSYGGYVSSANGQPTWAFSTTPY